MDVYLSVIHQYVHRRLRTVDRLVRDGQQNCARRDWWSHLSLVFNCPPIIFHLSRQSGALWCRSTGTNPSPATALTLEGGQHQNQNQVSPTFGVSDDAPRCNHGGPLNTKAKTQDKEAVEHILSSTTQSKEDSQDSLEAN